MMMQAKTKTRKDKTGEVIAYSELAIRQNHGILEYCRISMAALSGCTAGVLGLTSFYGFIFYFLMAIILWIMILAKAGNDWPKYFRSRFNILTNGLGGGLFTYILFWTFLYGMVHVY